MAAVKKSISLPDSLCKLAEQAAKDEHCATFSDYIQSVIKEDLARRGTLGTVLREEPIRYPSRRPAKPRVGKN